MPKEIDPDLRQAYEALAEAKEKLADPRRFYTRSDQLYPDPRYRPSYVDPSMEKPVYQGMLGGGAEESEVSPIDFIAEVPSLAKAGLKGIPALLATIKKKGSELPEDMSLLERIKLAAKKSGVKAPEMEAAQAEREALRNRPKDYFDKARSKDTQRILEENEKKIAEQAAAREAFKSEFNIPVAHGTSLEKTKGKVIEELNPSTGWNASYGEGVYTAPQTPRGTPTGDYSKGYGAMNVPLRIRGNKVFNFAGQQFDERYPELIGLIPKREESVSKLAKLSGVTEEEINKLIEGNYINKVSDLVKKHPEEFESMYFDKIFKTFEPKNIRSPFAKFDPAMKESGDILAGLAAAGLSFDQIKELLNKKSTDKDEL